MIKRHQIYVITLIAFFLTLIGGSESIAQFSDNSHVPQVLETPYQGDGSLKAFSFDQPLATPLTFKLTREMSNTLDDYNHNGMAIYLGQALLVELSGAKHVRIVKLKDDESQSSKADWTGYKGRFKSVLLSTENGHVDLSSEAVTVSWPVGTKPDLQILTGYPDTSARPVSGQPDFRALQYAHLPRWMRVLCRFVEAIYKGTASLGLGWGWSLLIFAVLIKILLFPASILTTRLQAQANRHKSALEPIFKNIKEKYNGETAHKKTMAAYKERGITPYYSLKPLLATMITLPILIAIFNMLGEVRPLKDASFLWIESLAYPDRMATLSFSLPFFGADINLLPFIMTGVTFYSAFSLRSETASRLELRRQKRNLYLMGVAFFIIFYPFPSGMVLYWTLSTALQFVVNRVYKTA